MDRSPTCHRAHGAGAIEPAMQASRLVDSVVSAAAQGLAVGCPADEEPPQVPESADSVVEKTGFAALCNILR